MTIIRTLEEAAEPLLPLGVTLGKQRDSTQNRMTLLFKSRDGLNDNEIKLVMIIAMKLYNF
jgi:hypothetical protein